MVIHEMFEAYSKEEVTEYLQLKKPDFWRRYTRQDIDMQKTIYGVNCYFTKREDKWGGMER